MELGHQIRPGQEFTLCSACSTQLCIHGNFGVPCWQLRNHNKSQEGIPTPFCAKKQGMNVKARMEARTVSMYLKPLRDWLHKDLTGSASSLFQYHWMLFETLAKLMIPTAVWANISVTRHILSSSSTLSLDCIIFTLLCLPQVNE